MYENYSTKLGLSNYKLFNTFGEHNAKSRWACGKIGTPKINNLVNPLLKLALYPMYINIVLQFLAGYLLNSYRVHHT